MSTVPPGDELWQAIAIGYCEWTNGDWPDDDDLAEARAASQHIAGYVRSWIARAAHNLARTEGSSMTDETPGLKAMLDRVWDRAELKTRGIDMTWACTRLEDVHEEGDEAHVHPVYEEHVIDRACWCGPRRIEDVEQYPIWLHRDMLDLHGPKDPAA